MSLDQLLSYGVEVARALIQLALGVATLVLGVYLIGSAGYRLARWGDPRRQYGFGSIAMRTGMGSAFLSAQWMVSTIAETVTGQGFDTNGAMSVFNAGGTPVQKIFGVALAWAAALGVVAVLRGGMLWVKASDSAHGGQMERDPWWTGAIFMFAGGIGINLWRFVGDLL